MTKFFSKYLGKIVLMVAAVLWVGCNDKEESAKQQKPVSSSSASAKFDSIVRAKESYEGMSGLAGYL